MDNAGTFIGMDFGTFKTSVASSNGQRDALYTAVGWPKDHVARAMLGRDVVFGDDIVDQRLALDVVRPFARGELKYSECAQNGSEREIERRKEAARLLVAHAVSRTRPEDGIPLFGVIGAPSRATIQNKQVVTEAAASVFDAVMIVPEPFAIAYGMNRLTDTLVVDVGAGTTDICPVCGTYPREEDQVTVPIGGDMIDELFLQLLREAHPQAQLSERMAREIKEKHGFVHDVNEKAIVTLRCQGQPRQFDVTASLKEACTKIVGPIVAGIQETVSRFDPEYQRPLLNNILLGGGGSQLNGLDVLIEQSLQQYGGGRVTKVYDSVFAGAVGALKMAMNMPQDRWDHLRTTDLQKAVA